MRRIRKTGKQETFIRIVLFICVPAFLIFFSGSLRAAPVVIGSKKFTESYVLGEIAKRSLIDAGISVEHRQGMGGTIILWEALRSGQIDVYPEYTGTITQEILKRGDQLTFEQIASELGKIGIGMTEPLGFNNTYALVMLRSRAQKLGLRTVSDLRNHPELKFGLTHEFLDRQDGWRPLAQQYQLNPHSLIGIDHALGYAALANRSIDVKDAYSTDAKIAEYDLVTLEDDQQFFSKYQAVFLFRLSLPTKAITALRKLEGTIDEQKVIWLNFFAQTRALDASPSRAGWVFPAAFSAGWNSAWHLGESRRRCRTRHSWFCRRRANDSLAGIARAACSAAVFRNQRADCNRGALSLWFATDCPQHRDWPAGHSARVARICGCAGPELDSAALANSFADGVAFNSRRN